MSKKKRLDKAAVSEATERTVDKSPMVHQRDKIDFKLNIRERNDFTEKQKKLIDIILDKKTKLIFIDGPAGTSKTFLGIYCALQLLNARTHSDVLYVRSIIESASKSLGTLPGSIEERLNPFLIPLQDKLEELLDFHEMTRLLREERVVGFPINYMRGAHFNARCIIGDEVQNCSTAEILTLITRMGQFSKMILLGDKMQNDLNGKSGWTKMFDLFNDEESRDHGIHCFSFTKDDIVRSGLVRYIAEKYERQQMASVKSEPMFPSK
jgi:phosphate starvation-inducible protein PhoH and related proteins